MTPAPIKVLLIEDNPFDAALVERELRDGGLDVTVERVDIRPDFVAALTWPPDVVLVDYNLPEFDLFTAMDLARGAGLDLPFIVVTGHVDDEVAVECIKRGADDYVVKDRMRRLPSAVTGALEQRALRRRTERTEAERRNEQAVKAAILDSTLDAIVTAEPDGTILDFNRAAESTFGYTRDEAIGKDLADLLFPLEDPSLRHDVFLAPAGPSLVPQLAERREVQALRADGSVFPAEIALTDVRLPTGRLVTAVIRDVSARRQMERTLRDNEALFHGAFAAAQTGIALIDAATSRYVDVNDAFCTMVGYPKEELLALDWVTITHPEDRGPNLQQVGAYVEGSKEVTEVSKRYVRKDGVVISVEISDALVRDEDGVALYFVTHVKDVTERDKAEEALTKSQALLQQVVDNSPAAIYIKDVHGRYLLTNSKFSEVAGVDRDEALGRTDFDLFPPAVAAAVTAADTAVFEQRAALEVEESVPGQDGIVRTFLSVKFPLVNDDGEPQSLVGISTDISERVKATEDKARLEAQLTQAQKLEAIGQLAGGVAHDFNNILAVILNYAEFFLGDLGCNDPRRADVEQIIDAGGRAARLVHQLLAFSRRDATESAAVDLNAVVSGMHELVVRAIGEQVTLETSCSGDLWTVDADVGQIEQIILNLAINARDAMPSGGLLSIETANEVLQLGAAPGRYVKLGVADTGSGIDPATLERIFEPFFTTKARGEGTGLGLSTVYGIVTQAGGHVTVDSTLGAGTSFTVYLPATPAAAEGAGRPAPAPPADATGRTILVVDDDDAMRELVCRILERDGFAVLATRSATQVLDWARDPGQRVDLLLTDVLMPGTSGRALAKAVEALRPGLRTLYMSGYSDDGTYDGEEMIEKPFSADELVSRVLGALLVGAGS
ncbi:MAG TPA: PAS domain S-box protein [Actinomycetota bacterium]|nr:PAS domain S-box protein [Actinomycetota bacterium]